MRGLFVTGTGTGVGKTFVTRGIARALATAGVSVAAVKPVETGCDPTPADAIQLARACGRPTLAHARGLYRAHAPLAPWAATRRGEPAPPPVADLAESARRAAEPADVLLCEGAGGLLVPLDAETTMADLARELELPCLLVAHDALGVLSHTRAVVECALARGLRLAGVVLTRHGAPDPSRDDNLALLRDWLAPTPIHAFGRAADDDDALADAARASGLDALALHSKAGSPVMS